jgi:hypothetical protein
LDLLAIGIKEYTDVSHGIFEIDATGFVACGPDRWFGVRFFWVG